MSEVPKMPSTDEVFIHKSSYVDEGAMVGRGSKIWHFSHVQSGAIIGERCIIGQNVNVAPGAIVGNGVKIQNNVSVYKGVTVEDDVFLGPSMVFTNVNNPRAFIERKEEFRPTLIKKGATVGANATIVCGCTIGEYAFVGAGCVVTKSIPPYAIVVGVPQKLMGWICQCGVKFPLPTESLDKEDMRVLCRSCRKGYIVSKCSMRPVED